MKKFLCILLAMIMAFSVCACGGASTGDRVVTDIVGREVGMSEEPQNIAAMAGPTYEMTFMLAYSNGSFSYIPDEKAFGYDCYEKNTCRYLKGTGEDIAATHVRLLNQLKKQQ